MPKVSDSERLKDYKEYQHATHADLLKLTRELIAMDMGDLIKLHKQKADRLGATSPTAIFVRAVLFTRLANGQIGNGKPSAE